MKYCAVLALVLAFNGCVYSFRGASLPPGVHSVAVQVFDDKSGFGDPNLRIDLTNMLTQQLISDNTYQVTSMSTADAAIIGTINNVTTQPVSIQGNEQVGKWQITVNVSVRFENLKTQKDIWTKQFSDWGEYDPSAGPSNRAAGLSQAEDKLSQDILLALVTNW